MSSKPRCKMIRKDKFHLTLLVCAAILCLVANGSAVAEGDRQSNLDLAGNASGTAVTDEYLESAPGSGTAYDESGMAVTETQDDMAPLYVNGALDSECLVVDGTAWMSLGRFALLAGLTYDGVYIAGVKPEISDGGDYAVLNGRYFYLPDGLYDQGGELLWPLRVLADMFSCTVAWDETSGSIDLDVTRAAIAESGDTYYNEQDVYWLSRIIYAESGNQPLAGQIGVGNVVLNRVESPLFPDTVYAVIFDRTYGVQFSPVETGGIYCEPDEEAIIAAKLALGGYETVGDSLYFVNPSIGAVSWFASNFTFVARIGDHDFYA